MDDMLFNDWQALVRILVVGSMSYVGLLVLLRISGKRTLSQMNQFDFIITVALGSTLSSVITNEKFSVADGLLAVGLLIALQFIITWLSVRSKKVSRLVKSQPHLLFYGGEFLEAEMHKARVVQEEVFAAVREKGCQTLEEVHAVVLETNGRLSVITNGEAAGERSTLSHVKGSRKVDI